MSEGLNKQQLEALRNILPKGYLKTLAARTAYSYETVKKVLYGEYFNRKILSEAIKYATEHKEEIEEMAKKIDELGDE